MDFVAVLRNPDNDLDEEVLRRLRSQSRRQMIERLILFGLLLVSFISQLILQMQVLELKANLAELNEKQKVEDINSAKEIVFNYNKVETYSLSQTAETAKSRTQRTVNSQYPHFEIQGSGESSNDGVFTWNTSRLGYGFRPVPPHGYAKEIQITQTGMYRVYGKVAINGRNVQSRRHSPQHRRTIEQMNPAFGLFLMKKNVEEDIFTLDRTWKTQDQRGINPYNDRIPVENQMSKTYPLDTLEISGGFLLLENDVIYLQRPTDSLFDPNEERFLNDDQFARFEAYRYA